jgi:hypothetical protein
MDRRTIDWSTANVSRGTSGFDLSVELDGEVSSDWQTLFTQLAEQDALTVHERGWSIVRLAERTITMERLQHEARESARAYLSDIVGRTNNAVAAKLEEDERERLRAEREAADLVRAGEELAEWFRTAGARRPVAAPDAGRGESWETGNGQPDGADEAVRRAGDSNADQPKDLRDRFAHPFGTGGD